MSKARDNARKIGTILEDRAGYADLYRTCTAGPSGQRKDVHVGRVEYTHQGAYEVQVFTPDMHGEAGFAARSSGGKHAGMWTFWQDNGGGGALLGWASSLSLGADVLVNGAHAATGRHDSRRTSSGKWEAYTPKDV